MTFHSTRIGGAILSGDLPAKVERDYFPGLKPADFGLPAWTKVKDEIARGCAEAQSLWATRDTILEIDDQFAEAQTTGKPFISPLNPPPGDLRACHPPREP